jgi:hypothetical protein
MLNKRGLEEGGLPPSVLGCIISEKKIDKSFEHFQGG